MLVFLSRRKLGKFLTDCQILIKQKIKMLISFPFENINYLKFNDLIFVRQCKVSLFS